VLEQLGIADQVKAKTKLGDIGYVLEPVARGEIEIGIQQITEILPVQGAVLVGPLPPSLQKTTTYVVLQATQAKDKATAVEFMRYLQTPASASVFERKGFSKPR
jgi:molybdate transport system substrate-binding protein